ncbi:MAG: hypothetical protein R3A78_10820 [Polyangiales bacterium]
MGSQPGDDVQGSDGPTPDGRSNPRGPNPAPSEMDADGGNPDAHVSTTEDSGTSNQTVPDGCATPTVGWPDATNTGVGPGVTLTPSGSVHATTAGMTIENLEITGTVTVSAHDVTIRNCLIRSPGNAIVVEKSALNVVVENVTLIGTNRTSSAFSTQGIRIFGDHSYDGQRATFCRIDVSGYPSAALMEGGGVTFMDSYFHDLSIAWTEGGNSGKRGSDVIGAFAGDKYVIRHNTLEMDTGWANCVVKFPCDLSWDGFDYGRGQDIDVDNNLMAGAGWTMCAGLECPLWSGSKIIGYEPVNRRWKNVRVTNNHFSKKFFPKCGGYGPIAYSDGSESGNVWEETGEPL